MIYVFIAFLIGIAYATFIEHAPLQRLFVAGYLLFIACTILNACSGSVSVSSKPDTNLPAHETYTPSTDDKTICYGGILYFKLQYGYIGGPVYTPGSLYPKECK
jgi:hypothetical protein